uniref:Fusion DH n=1 Tax=Streptomyces sp. MJ635-86F5 TaxID=1321967 RepID=UPI0012B67D84|nr:Chain A, Fusion DH [Streptomyces sp. MJ635-86F5]6K97_B Chain B, Fusion DH [Streptomyces sp. MJ635-86F5]
MNHKVHHHHHHIEGRHMPAPAGDAAGLGLEATEHPLLATATELPDGGYLFTGRLALREHPWLADHTIAGTTIVPGTAFVELALHAADIAGCDEITELVLHTPLVLSTQSSSLLQVAVGPADPSGARSLTIRSHGEDVRLWVEHADGSIGPGETAPELPEPVRVGLVPRGSGMTGSEEAFASADGTDEAWPPPGGDAWDTAGLYARLADRGFQYGETFRGLRAAWSSGEDIYADVEVGAPASSPKPEAFHVHPALLDAALHAALGPLLDGEEGLFLPFALRRVRVHHSGAKSLRVHITPDGDKSVSLSAVDAAGNAVVSVGSVALRPVSSAQLAAAAGRNG